MTSRSFADLKKTADDATRPLPDGAYEVVVSKAEATMASTGSPMIKAQLRVIDGQFKNRVLFTNFVLSVDSDFALSIFFNNMAALGLDDAFFNTLTDDHALAMETIAQLILGRQATANVSSRTWNGQLRNEVGNLTRSASAGVFNNNTYGISPAGGASSMTPPSGLPATPPVPSIPSTNAAAPSVPSVPSVSNVPVPPAPAF